MYKKSNLSFYVFISVSNLLLLSGCLNKQMQTKPEVQTESITNIEVETPSKIETATIAELMPEQQQSANQNPALAAASTAKVVHLTSSAQLEELIKTGNVVVDFFATWCGPCKSVSPIIDRLAQQYAGKVLFVKVDVDKFKDIAAKFGIKGMPTFHFYKNGSKVDSFSGGRAKTDFEQKIKSYFNI